jgi:hypothetical protein
LIVYAPLENLLLICGDVAVEELLNLDLFSAPRAFEQGGIFIVPYLL